MHAEAALQVGIRIHITHVDGRQAHDAPEAGELFQHVLAELTVAPLHDGEPGTVIRRVSADGQCPGEPIATAGSDLVTEVAIKRTVFGGTSPTAVTLWPSMTVVNAEAEPTLATPATAC